MNKLDWIVAMWDRDGSDSITFSTINVNEQNIRNIKLSGKFDVEVLDDEATSEVNSMVSGYGFNKFSIGRGYGTFEVDKLRARKVS